MAMNFQDVIRDVHDPVNHSLQTSGGGATIFAVVNTGAVGVGNSIVTIANTPLSTQIIGNVTISPSVNSIGFATVAVSNPTLYAVVNTTAASGVETIFVGTPTLYAVVNTSAPGITNSIVTVANTVSTTFAGNVTLDAGSKTGIVGNVSISSQVAWADPKTFVGLVTVSMGKPAVATSGSGAESTGFQMLGTDGTNAQTIRTGADGRIQGNVTINNTSRSILGNVTLDAGSFTGIKGNITISPSVNWIGFATVSQVNQPALVAGAAYIGLASVNVGAIAAGANFVGLVSVQGNVVTGGTSKTLVIKNIAISTSGDATILVPTATFKVTHLTLGSDATVRVTIKSGATYVLGNASVGITLFPGGGWVENGAPASPVYIGLVAQNAFVVNTSATANVGGKVVYFDE